MNISINILFVAHHHDLSGANQSLLSLLDGLREYSINPFFVLSQEGDFAKALSARSIPYRMVPVPYWMMEKKFSLRRKMEFAGQIYQSVKMIGRVAREWDINVIYTNTSVSPVGIIAATLNGIPHIWHFRELAELHFSWKFIFPRFVSLALIKSSAAVISVCKAVMNYYFEPGAKRAHVVYNGIATKNRYDALYRQKHNRPAHSGYVFSIIGSLTQQKGQETAIHAIAELRRKGIQAKLIVVGTGRVVIVSRLKQLAESLDLSSAVEFTGQIDDAYDIYFASDCLLMCSDFEGLSRVTLEAMSACLPVIGKNNGGTPEIILHEQTGLLYDTFDELVVAMTRLAENPVWGVQLGAAGWKLAKERFCVENYAADIYKIIQSVLKAERA